MNVEFTDHQFSESVSFAEHIHSAQDTVAEERNKRIAESGVIEFIKDERGWSSRMIEMKPGTVDGLSPDKTPGYIALETNAHPMGGVSSYRVKAIPQSFAEGASSELQWLSSANPIESGPILNQRVSRVRSDSTISLLSFAAFKEKLNEGSFLKR